MKKSLILAGMLSIGYAHAQQGRVGINTEKPKATMEIVAKSTDQAKGLLIPRLTGQQLLDMQVGADQHALLVYMTEPVAGTKRTGAFTNVDNEGYYYYYADKVTPTNSYWKKILDVGEHLPRYNFINKDGIDNDIAIDNYYNNVYDGANFVIQNYLGNPTNKTALPHNLSSIGKERIYTGGLNVKVKLGNAFDDYNYASPLNTRGIFELQTFYFGINNENKVDAGFYLSTGGDSGLITVNDNNDKNILLSTYKKNSSVKIEGKLSVSQIPIYDSDREADADTTLLSGSLYRLSDFGRQVFVKP